MRGRRQGRREQLRQPGVEKGGDERVSEETKLNRWSVSKVEERYKEDYEEMEEEEEEEE